MLQDTIWLLCVYLLGAFCKGRRSILFTTMLKFILYVVVKIVIVKSKIFISVLNYITIDDDVISAKAYYLG